MKINDLNSVKSPKDLAKELIDAFYHNPNVGNEAVSVAAFTERVLSLPASIRVAVFAEFLTTFRFDTERFVVTESSCFSFELPESVPAYMERYRAFKQSSCVATAEQLQTIVRTHVSPEEAARRILEHVGTLTYPEQYVFMGFLLTLNFVPYFWHLLPDPPESAQLRPELYDELERRNLLSVSLLQHLLSEEALDHPHAELLGISRSVLEILDRAKIADDRAFLLCAVIQAARHAPCLCQGEELIAKLLSKLAAEGRLSGVALHISCPHDDEDDQFPN